MHILPNISRYKGNQTMKFGQLIEYNMRNMILENSYIKCSAETSPRHFPGKLKLSISLDQKFYIVCFYCIPNWNILKNISKLLYWN